MRKYLFLFLFFLLTLPSVVSAALININTADATLLDTLPGIGPSKAAAIVDYRTQHGPFARIEDIQNVTGIGPSTYADLAAFITVGDTGTVNTATDTTNEASTTPVQSSTGSGSALYTPPPSSLLVAVTASSGAFLNVPLHLSARVTTKGGAVDANARIVWGFGDGSSAEGTVSDKTYRYAGTYVITVDATDGSTIGHDELIVVVRPTQVSLSSISGGGVTIRNEATDRLDLSDWRLSADTVTFHIPHGTIVLPQSSVLFPSTITNIPVSSDTVLQYPDGMVAARFTPPTVTAPEVQLSPSTTGFNVRQTVDVLPSAGYDASSPVSNTNVSIPAHENTSVSAPTAAIELAAVGAPLPPEVTTPAPTPKSVLRSPWTLGLLGVIVAAGSAFILL